MTTDWDSASHAARANWIGATTLNYEISAFWQNNIPVTAGATYTFSGRMSVTVSAGASRTASIGVSFYDASNNNLLFSTTPDVPENAGFVSASRTVVAPANAATVHVVLYVAETTGCVALFDDIYFGTSDPVPTVSFTATPSSISSGSSSKNGNSSVNSGKNM